MMHHQKFFFSLASLAVVFGILQGSTFIYKRYISKTYLPKTVATQVATPEGMFRDTSYTIPNTFPEGLIEQSDVEAIVESYTFTQQGSPTQHTFEYISRRSLGGAQKFITDYFKKNKITLGQNLSITESIISITGGSKDINLNITLRENADKKVSIELTTFK